MQLRKLTASLLAFLFLFCSLPFFAAAEEAEENEIYQIWSRDRDITPDIHITDWLSCTDDVTAHALMPWLIRH